MNRFEDDFAPSNQREWDMVRTALLEQDDWKCSYCGCELKWKSSSIDHLIPRAQGGSDHFVNLGICCGSCNSRKNARCVLEWLDAPAYAELAAEDCL